MKDLAQVLTGFKEFRERYFSSGDSPYRSLAQVGQAPQILLVGCSDSRVDPALLFSASPGDFFVVRNVANLVPPFQPEGGYHGVSSALEFGVVNLKVKHIMVLGHRQCGGIRALMTGIDNPEPSFIEGWMGLVGEAKSQVLSRYGALSVEEQCAHCEMEAIRVSLRNLETFPFVRRAVKEGRLSLVGAYFDLEKGSLFTLSPGQSDFVPFR